MKQVRSLEKSRQIRNGIKSGLQRCI